MNVFKGHPNIFFTSDWHLGHEFMTKGIPGQKIPRPMFSCAEEMSETIISKNNERVRKGDKVYNDGDFAIKISDDLAWDYYRRLNGQQFLIEGNHEQVATKLHKRGAFIWIKQMETLSLGQPYFGDNEKQTIVLCHYAMTVWKNSHHGSWQLYGHSHGMLPEAPHKLQFDIGVDCWNFYPVSIEEVKMKMKEKLPAWEAYKESLRGTGRAE